MPKKNKNKNNKQQVKKAEPKKQEKVEISGKLGLFIEHRILFWLILFPPVAIYRLLKYKIIGKFAGTVLILFLLTILAFCTLFAVNPSYVAETQVEAKLEDMGYGKVRDVEYLGVYHDLHMSEVITTNGFYTIYYDYSDNGKLFMNTIVELHTEIADDMVYNQFTAVYTTDKTNQLLTLINPAAIKFIIKNDNYGDIEEVLESTNGVQMFKTTKGTYQFNYQYYETTNIQRLNADNVFEDVMNRDYIIEMKDEFKNALNQKNVIPLYYKIEEVLSYGITENEIYYIFVNFCGNKYRVVKFNDGRITLDVATTGNPVTQEDLAEAWENYQKAQVDPNAK